MMHSNDVVKISRKSWHYRAVKWMYVNHLWDEEYKLLNWKSLCQYGRRFILSIFFYLFAVPFLFPAFIAAFIVSSKYGADEIDPRTAGYISQFVVISVLLLPFWVKLNLVYGWFKLELVAGAPWYYYVVSSFAYIDLVIIVVFIVVSGLDMFISLIWNSYLKVIWNSFQENFIEGVPKEKAASAITVVKKTYLAWKKRACPPFEYVD